jgi:hypothetical protein
LGFEASLVTYRQKTGASNDAPVSANINKSRKPIMTLRLIPAFLILSLFAQPPVPAAGDEAENLFEQSCTKCHNRENLQDKIKNKRLNREAWNDVIQRMISTYAAEVPRNKQAELVDYLMKTFSSASGDAPAGK